jgi:hypothetical protein
MPKFRKKPTEIEAEQYVEYGKLVKGMCNSRSCFVKGNDEPHVHTIHNGQIVNLEVNDWVIPEPDGVHYYPVKPDIFKNTYDAVTPQWMLDDEVGKGGPVVTDSDRLNKLQNLTEGYLRGWILRRSSFGRGIRLHETSHDGANPDVRKAIDDYTPLTTGLKFDNEPKNK